MQVVFIGAGNLATRLALSLWKSGGCQIVQVFSRTDESAQALAMQVGAEAVTDIGQLVVGADLYVFSVKDSALEGLLGRMPATKGIWVHTAGSIPAKVFDGYHGDFGVFYPFQTFSRNREVDFGEIPVFIEASDGQVLGVLRRLAANLSVKVYELASDKRKYLHLCGVLACNFVNHLYAVSESVLASQNIPFEVLLPLIDETARKIHDMPPHEAQTGPAVRYDANVMQGHLSLLEDERLKTIYELLSRNIYEIHKKNNEQ